LHCCLQGLMSTQSDSYLHASYKIAFAAARLGSADRQHVAARIHSSCQCQARAGSIGVPDATMPTDFSVRNTSKKAAALNGIVTMRVISSAPTETSDLGKNASGTAKSLCGGWGGSRRWQMPRRLWLRRGWPSRSTASFPCEAAQPRRLLRRGSRASSIPTSPIQSSRSSVRCRCSC
jgi:hypothetical protein